MTDTNEGYAYDITGYPAITLSQYGYSDTGTAAECMQLPLDHSAY